MANSNRDPEHEFHVRTIELHTPNGVLRGKVGVRNGPMALATLAPTVYQMTGVLVERANQLEILAGRTISCCAGCGACCRQMVPLSPPEAFHLMDVIDSFEPERRQAVLGRFERIVDQLDARGMIGRLLDPQDTGEATLPVAREYFMLGLACPFLVDESCSIHPQRPVACRDYNVTSPAEWCARPYEHEIAKVPMPLPLSTALARLTARLSGEKACLIPLTLVPRWVSEHAALRARRWPGPKLFDLLQAELNSNAGA